VEQVHLLYRQGKIQELENWAKNLIYQEKLAQYLLILIEKNDASSEEKINQYTRSDTRDWQALMGDLEKSFL
jgi:hypothetical protein